MNKYLAIILLIGLFSCEEEIKINVPESSHKLAFFGIVYQGLPVNVLLSRTYQFTEENVDFRAPNALVVLLENGISIDTLTETLVDLSQPPTLGSNLSYTHYFTDYPLFMVPGKTYAVQVITGEFDSVQTEAILFAPIVDNISISGLEQLWSRSGEEENVQLLTDAIFLKEKKGDLELAIKYYFEGEAYSDEASIRSNTPPFDESFAFANVILKNPEEGEINLTTEYTYQASSQSFGEVIAVVEVTFFEEEYLLFKEIIKRGRFEEFVSLQNNIEPLPNNVEGAYGYFSLAERYRFTKTFP